MKLTEIYNRLAIESQLSEGYDNLSPEALSKLPKIDAYKPSGKKSFNDFTMLFLKDKSDEIFGFLGTVKVFNNADGSEIAKATFGPDENGQLNGHIDVRADMRRKRIGTEIYKYIEELTNDTLKPASNHTDMAKAFWNQKDRPFGKTNELHEGRKRYKWGELKKNSVVLTDEEKKEVIAKDAVWGNDDLAVWKSEVDGETVYITHTHRAFNTAKSLNAIINRFHNFIKGTA